MKKVLISLALFGLAAAPAYAASPLSTAGLNSQTPVFAQKDCKEGEKWNEATQKCDAKEG